LIREHVESVSFRCADLKAMLAKHDPHKLKNGFHTVAGEDIFLIPNPVLRQNGRDF